MRKYCEGLGVFEIDSTNTYELREDSRSRKYKIYHIGDGKWAFEYPSEGLSAELKEVNSIEAAELFTRYGVDIPENLVSEVETILTKES